MGRCSNRVSSISVTDDYSRVFLSFITFNEESNGIFSDNGGCIGILFSRPIPRRKEIVKKMKNNC